MTWVQIFTIVCSLGTIVMVFLMHRTHKRTVALLRMRFGLREAELDRLRAEQRTRLYQEAYVTHDRLRAAQYRATVANPRLTDTEQTALDRLYERREQDD